MNSTSLRKSSIALAIVAAMCAGGATASTSGASLLAVARATTLHHGDAVMGVLPASHPMHVVIALKVRDSDGLDAFVKSAAKNPLAVKPMSHDAFMANHAPSQVQAQTVANYLTSMGFSNVQISSNRMLVSADGNAAAAGKAFLTSFAQVKTHDGRTAYANTSPVNIPASLGGTVLSVLGMQNVNQAHVIQPRRMGSAHTMDITGHNPVEWSSIYSGTGVATASTVTVGIFTNGDVSPSITDLGSFTTSNSLAPVTTSVVKTNGGGTDTSGQIEWDIDSQDIVGMGGGQVGGLIFYTAPTLSDADMIANANTIVTANAVKIINVSIGGCELGAQASGASAATDQIAEVGVAQGQTFSISTGDSGADECGNGGTTPSWPANSPYVVAVAGTTLDASTTTWNSETVWPGSGGSASTYEPKPSYQELLVPGNFRGVADVTFAGDPNSGAKVVVNGALQQWGGTSLAAPIFAGLWARVLATKGTDYGFANPYIYQLPQADFHDITSGSNGISAGVGYDFASGRGSIILNQAINDIGKPVGKPPKANFSYVATGLKLVFTDSSTDADGTVTNHFWNFGDGTPQQTTANVTHWFPGAGIYNVSETVADNDLNLATKTLKVKVKAAPGPIKNNGFEDGSAPWKMSSPAIHANGGGELAHGGQWFAWLGGDKSKGTTDILVQHITIPAGKTSASLNYWLHIDTYEVSKIRTFDKLTVGIYDTKTSALLVACPGFSSLTPIDGYQKQSCDISPAIGKNVDVRFYAKQDATLQTSFVVDDVAVELK